MLAKQMVAIGKACGRNVTAILTNMDVPLGYHVGNALEVIEAVEVLKGRGSSDLREICVALASNLVSMCRGISLEDAEEKVLQSIDSGMAMNVMRTWIRAQGGNAEALDDYSLLPQAKVQYELRSPTDGYIRSMDTRLVGQSSAILGAGRAKKEDNVDHAAGIVLKKKTGDYVHAGETLAVLHTNKPQSIEDAQKSLFILAGITPWTG